jgi:putative sigma-54 modulation protein
MQLEVKGKNLDVSDSIRGYAEQKLEKLRKQLAEETIVHIELAVEKNPKIRESQVAEATIFVKGDILRAREATPDMKSSLDGLSEKLVRELKTYREKRREEPRRRAEHNGVE